MRSFAPLGYFVAQLQANRGRRAGLALAVAPTYTTKQDVNTALAVGNAGVTDLPDLMFEGHLAERRDL